MLEVSKRNSVLARGLSLRGREVRSEGSCGSQEIAGSTPWACGVWSLHGKCPPSVRGPASPSVLTPPASQQPSWISVTALVGRVEGLPVSVWFDRELSRCTFKGKGHLLTPREEKQTPRRAGFSKVLRELSLTLFVQEVFLPVNCIFLESEPGCANLFSVAEHLEVSFLCRR